MPFFFAFPSSFDLYPFSFSPPVSTSTIRLSDLTHDIVELSPRSCFGGAVAFSCSFCYLMWVLRVLEQAVCKVAFKYPGSFAPSRWFPPALKQTREREPFTRPGSCPQRASPMRTASVNLAPAVPYHTPIRAVFKPRVLFLLKKRAI